MSYRLHAIKGFSWHSLVKIITAGLSLLKIIILARLLQPADFGLFSLTTIALGISEAATQTGINTTMIQSKHSVSYFLSTAWVIAILRGFAIAVLMALVGMGMNRFYQEEQLLFLVGLASLIPIIKGLINPSIVSLYKSLNFFGDSVYRVALVLSDSLFAIGLALLTRSVYALIWAMIITSVLEVIGSFLFFSERPQFSFVKSRARTILHNAKWLNGLAFLSYAHDNLDNFLIGKLTGVTNLGFYHNAYGLSHRPDEIFAKASTHSSLPILVRLNYDAVRFRSAVIKTLASSMTIITLVCLPIIIFPELITTLILGQNWLEVVPLLRPLVLAGLLHSFAGVSYNVFISTKQYLFMYLHLLLATTLMVVLIFVLGNSYGLLGAVWAVLFSRVIALPIVIFGMRHVFKSL